MGSLGLSDEKSQDGDGQADDAGGLQPQRAVEVGLRRERFEVDFRDVITDGVANGVHDGLGLSFLDAGGLQAFDDRVGVEGDRCSFCVVWAAHVNACAFLTDRNETHDDETDQVPRSQADHLAIALDDLSGHH